MLINFEKRIDVEYLESTRPKRRTPKTFFFGMDYVAPVHNRLIGFVRTHHVVSRDFGVWSGDAHNVRKSDGRFHLATVGVDDIK